MSRVFCFLEAGRRAIATITAWRADIELTLAASITSTPPVVRRLSARFLQFYCASKPAKTQFPSVSHSTTHMLAKFKMAPPVNRVCNCGCLIIAVSASLSKAKVRSLADNNRTSIRTSVRGRISHSHGLRNCAIIDSTTGLPAVKNADRTSRHWRKSTSFKQWRAPNTSPSGCKILRNKHILVAGRNIGENLEIRVLTLNFVFRRGERDNSERFALFSATITVEQLTTGR